MDDIKIKPWSAYEFDSNLFVIKAENRVGYFDEQTCIIPFYAIRKIVAVEDEYVVVALRKQLSPKLSFDKIMLQYEDLGNRTIHFKDQFEKQMFLKYAQNFIDYYNE